MSDRDVLESRDRMEPVQRVGDCPHAAEMGRVYRPHEDVIRCGYCGAPIAWKPKEA